MQLRDDQWQQIESMLPGRVGDRGCSGADNRLFVEAVLWVARTGRPWRELPEEFGLPNTAFQRFARWSRAGVWHWVFATLNRDRHFRKKFMNSAIVRDHQPGSLLRAPSGVIKKNKKLVNLKANCDSQY